MCSSALLSFCEARKNTFVCLHPHTYGRRGNMLESALSVLSRSMSRFGPRTQIT